MAFHNTASRYIYSLGREGVLPSMLGNTHDTYKSPHTASIVQSILAAVWIILFGIVQWHQRPERPGLSRRLHALRRVWARGCC